MAYLGEIKIFAFNFVPLDYHICDGTRLKKNSYEMLYQLLGDKFTYDNSDHSTFAIPDLRNRFILQPESQANIGEQKGQNEVVMSMSQMPKHIHEVSLIGDNSNGGDEGAASPQNAFLNNNAGNFSSSVSDNTFLGGVSEENIGLANPINVKNASVKMVYAICIKGDSPSTVTMMEGFIGEVRVWPSSSIIPRGWLICDGKTYKESDNRALYRKIGTSYGGNIAGHQFNLPNFTNRLAVGSRDISTVGQTGGKTRITLEKDQLPPHSHQVKLGVNSDIDYSPIDANSNNNFINSEAGKFSQEVSEVAKLGGLEQVEKGENTELDIANSTLGVLYIICSLGLLDPNPEDCTTGEIRMYAGYDSNRFEGFQACHGQQLPIVEYQNMFVLIGNFYGGNPNYSFSLPDLRDKIPVCTSNSNDVGKNDGANTIKLTSDNLPPHKHNVRLLTNDQNAGTLAVIENGILNKNTGPFSTKSTAGSYLAGIKETPLQGKAIDIRNPFLSINYIICLKGQMPLRH